MAAIALPVSDVTNYLRKQLDFTTSLKVEKTTLNEGGKDDEGAEFDVVQRLEVLVKVTVGEHVGGGVEEWIFA